MILIVDSGSTKSDWIAVDNNGKQLFENVYFYGAGCGTDRGKALVKNTLQEVFIHADITVEEDTMAAVYGTISKVNEAAVVCILGTGSNCSYYDGNLLHQRVQSLGYILMDDAAGNYYGKQLIRDYYFNLMPEDIKVAFGSKYNLEADYVKYNIYKQPFPNAYLANFAEFMFLNKDSEYIINVIKTGLRIFVKNYIMQYQEELKTVPVHFAGSIAFFAQDEIREVAKEMGFTVGNFERRPIEGLVKFHTVGL